MSEFLTTLSWGNHGVVATSLILTCMELSLRRFGFNLNNWLYLHLLLVVVVVVVSVCDVLMH